MQHSIAQLLATSAKKYQQKTLELRKNLIDTISQIVRYDIDDSLEKHAPKFINELINKKGSN